MLKIKHPTILASGSYARKEMLTNAGLNFETIPADIDEDKVIAQMSDKNIKDTAQELASQKALAVSKTHKDAWVIGSDQILEFEGALFQKAPNIDAAREKLKTLRGQTHQLISAVSVARNNEVIWRNIDTAFLTMHDFTDQFLEEYLIAAGDDIMKCVGAYAFEKHGAWLFEKIDANFFTILGMPLLPLLTFLNAENNHT